MVEFLQHLASRRTTDSAAKFSKGIPVSCDAMLDPTSCLPRPSPGTISPVPDDWSGGGVNLHTLLSTRAQNNVSPHWSARRHPK
ncbi:hypothetical protein FA13DRAFT_1735891 [Coprinellus micaceus]|uniref:Uncharacterized protein n=1 Tax=Coprinellus micaceus TaxID=71717 RepID=A0A4Y7T273_COPMI|nr:hypothetical protein FA13DRAFT_1735891 [Coprinellus micaceus]